MDCDALKRFNTAMASEAILCRDGVRRVETESSALATDWKSACRWFDSAPGHQPFQFQINVL